jgi:thymidylate synthase (FAD)
VRELIRHRAFSFANESTRYVNLNKKGEFYFIRPYWYEESNKDVKNRFDYICNAAIAAYNFMLQHNYSPQQAREVLPLCTKSELVMTGFEDDWSNFLDIRLRGTTGKPHPDMIELAELIDNQLNIAKMQTNPIIKLNIKSL